MTCSEQCKANFGRSSDAPFPYEAFREAAHPDDREQAEAAARRAIEELGNYEAEYRCLWPDGSLHWIIARGRVLAENGKAIRMVGVTQDVTERRQAEEALRQSETRFRTMANVTPAIVWTAAPDGIIMFASDRWFEYTGIARDQNPRPLAAGASPRGRGTLHRRVGEGARGRDGVRDRGAQPQPRGRVSVVPHLRHAGAGRIGPDRSLVRLDHRYP
jgi:PAS domain-containing protein